MSLFHRTPSNLLSSLSPSSPPVTRRSPLLCALHVTKKGMGHGDGCMAPPARLATPQSGMWEAIEQVPGLFACAAARLRVHTIICQLDAGSCIIVCRARVQLPFFLLRRASLLLSLRLAHNPVALAWRGAHQAFCAFKVAPPG